MSTEGSQSRERIYKNGEFLFKEGEKGDELYIIQSGKVRIYKVQDDKEIILGTLEKGSVIGEMALFDNSARSASAQAITDTRAVFVSKDLFKKQLEKIPPWLASIVQIIIKRLRQTTKKVQDSADEDLSGKVAQLLSYLFTKYKQRVGRTDFIDFDNAVKEISALLEMESHKLNPHLKILIDFKIITIEKNKILLQNQDMLDFFIIYKQGVGEHNHEYNLSEHAFAALKQLKWYAEKHGGEIDLDEFSIEAEKLSGELIEDAQIEELIQAGILQKKSSKDSSADGKDKKVELNSSQVNKIWEYQSAVQRFEAAV